MTLQQQIHSFPYPCEIVPVFANACGNTFYIFDCLNEQTDFDKLKSFIWTHLSKTVVDDALVLRRIGNNIKMHVLEPDGTEADFCGNGARAVGAYLIKTYGNEQNSLISRRGEHTFLYEKDNCLVEMGAPKPIDGYLTLDGICFQFIDCVEPHLVTDQFFGVNELTHFGQKINQAWRCYFPQGINVNCYKKLDTQTIKALTFERGVYRITQACGTGSTACAKAFFDQVPFESLIVQVPGGTLHIKKDGESYWLGGPVSFMVQ